MWNNIKRIDDPSGNVCKFVYTKANAVAESVLYKYPTYSERTVICCSTQSGCPVGCRFCGAGDYFVRNLTAEEIVSQVNYSIDQTGADPSHMKRLQIMFMSMGEPMLNLNALIPALWELSALYPNAALLISTSAPKVDYNPIYNISHKIRNIGLQFSIHESTDKARDKLIPFKNKLHLIEIVDVGTQWAKVTKRHPFFNYCAHDGNDTERDADRIRSLFNPLVWNATISVVCERSEGLPASNQHQRDLAASFANKLVARGFDVRVFDPAGQDTIGGRLRAIALRPTVVYRQSRQSPPVDRTWLAGSPRANEGIVEHQYRQEEGWVAPGLRLSIYFPLATVILPVAVFRRPAYSPHHSRNENNA